MISSSKKIEGTPLLDSTKVQIRVIKALFVREMITHYGRKNLGFIWMFGEPMIFTIGIICLWIALRKTTHGTMPIVGFAITGYSSVLLWRHCITRITHSLKANSALLYHRNITLLDIALTRGIFEFSAVSVSGFLLSTFFILTNVINYPADILKVICAWILLGWTCISVGLIFFYLSIKSEFFSRASTVLMYVSVPLFGAMYMVSWIPKEAQKIALLIPTVNSIEMLREGFFGQIVKARYSISYLVTFNIFCFCLGLFLMSRIKKLGFE